MSKANKIKLGVAGVALVLAIILIFQNLEPVRVNLLFWTEVRTPAAFLVLISVLIGTVLGALATWIYFVRDRRR